MCRWVTFNLKLFRAGGPRFGVSVCDMSKSDELSDPTEDDRTMFEQLTARFRQFRPRSSLVRLAQVELLLHHTQFQTLAAPFLGLFLVLAFTHPGMEWWSWGWGMCLCLAYGARLVAIMRLKQSGADTLEQRLRIDLIDLAAAGVLWALAPHAVAMEGSEAQQIVGLFAGIVVLVGIVGNFLYYQSALVYFATWIVPVLYSLGFVYVDKFQDIGWTYIGVVLMFLVYTYKCLQVINLPLGKTLELNEALSQEKERVVLADRAKSDILAMMSHELRTPLTMIVGYSEIIRDQLFGPESRERYIEAAGSARNGAGLLVDLINDLLDLSALQARGRVMKIETLEIPALIDSAVELLQDTASKREIVIHPLPAVELPALAGGFTINDPVSDEHSRKRHKILAGRIENFHRCGTVWRVCADKGS